jgi:hypothetical protein
MGLTCPRVHVGPRVSFRGAIAMNPSKRPPPAAISCRSRGRPTCRTACCARSMRRPSITAAPTSPRSARP